MWHQEALTDRFSNHIKHHMTYKLESNRFGELLAYTYVTNVKTFIRKVATPMRGKRRTADKWWGYQRFQILIITRPCKVFSLVGAVERQEILCHLRTATEANTLWIRTQVMVFSPAQCIYSNQNYTLYNQLSPLFRCCTTPCSPFCPSPSS